MTHLELEKQHIEFRVITDVTIPDVIQFYKCAGRFPTNEEIKLVLKLGVDQVINILSKDTFLDVIRAIHDQQQMLENGNIKSKLSL